MEAATQSRSAKVQLATVLAGLEGGTVGVLWMLAWLGVSSLWQQRGFWSPENLMSTAFDRNATLAPMFTWATCGGLALYMLIYSLLGMIFASVVRGRVPRGRVMLVAVLFAVFWYYFTFRLVFPFAFPLVATLHVVRSTIVGHLLYGTMLGRYPIYFDRLMGAAPPAEASSQPEIEAPAAVATETCEPPHDAPPPEA
jgi:hypothetical protein